MAASANLIEDLMPWGGSRVDRMRYLLTTGFLSDIVAFVGPYPSTKYKVHRFILESSSPVFCNLFKQVGTRNQLFLSPSHDVDPVLFNLFLEHLYLGSCGIEADYCVPLLKLATNYQVQDLIDVCCTRLKKILTTQNVTRLFQEAMEVGNKDFITTTLDYLCRNARHVVEAECFYELKHDCLYEILKRDDLSVRTELQLFNAVLRWGQAECIRQKLDPKEAENLRNVLEKVLGLIRFPVMKAEEFTLNVANKNVLSKDDALTMYLFSTVSIDKRGGIPPGRFNPSPRMYHVPSCERGTTKVIENLKIGVQQNIVDAKSVPTEKPTRATATEPIPGVVNLPWTLLPGLERNGTGTIPEGPIATGAISTGTIGTGTKITGTTPLGSIAVGAEYHSNSQPGSVTQTSKANGTEPHLNVGTKMHIASRSQVGPTYLKSLQWMLKVPENLQFKTDTAISLVGLKLADPLKSFYPFEANNKNDFSGVRITAKITSFSTFKLLLNETKSHLKFDEVMGFNNPLALEADVWYDITASYTGIGKRWDSKCAVHHVLNFDETSVVGTGLRETVSGQCNEEGQIQNIRIQFRRRDADPFRLDWGSIDQLIFKTITPSF